MAFITFALLPADAWLAGVIGVAGGVVAVMWGLTRQRRNLARNLRNDFGPGCLIRIEFGDRAIHTVGPRSQSTIDYSAYESCMVRGDTVLLKYRQTAIVNLYAVLRIGAELRQRASRGSSISPFLTLTGSRIGP